MRMLTRACSRHGRQTCALTCSPWRTCEHQASLQNECSSLRVGMHGTSSCGGLVAISN